MRREPATDSRNFVLIVSHDFILAAKAGVVEQCCNFMLRYIYKNNPILGLFVGEFAERTITTLSVVTPEGIEPSLQG